MTAQTSILAQIKTELSVAPRSKMDTEFVRAQCIRKAWDWSELPRSVGDAAYGIQYALKTGRLDAEMMIAIERQLSAYRTIKLIAAIAEQNVINGDVPSWLWKNREFVMSLAQ